MKSSTSEGSRTNGHRAPISERQHVAHFYVDEEVLAEHVAAVAAGSLQNGEAFIMLATEAHTRAVNAHLRQLGLDVDGLRLSGKYVCLDAHRVMGRVVVDGAPSALLFGEIIGGAVARAEAQYGHVAAYGELVALLWSAGQRDAAVRVEQLWNELMRAHPLALLCGYPFEGRLDAAGFAAIADQHDDVQPPRDAA